jgi:glycosyltransferase involved in cell wall biosynthesis
VADGMQQALFVTDAWTPQTNGVVTTLQSVFRHLPDHGYLAEVIHPGLFDTLPLPGYPEIRMVRNPWRIAAMIAALRPHTIHIATEGPLGLWTRSLLQRWRIPFTTALHTKFPEYVRARIGLPVAVGYRLLRWFHRPAVQTLCTTESHRRELAHWGLEHLVVWGRGVDTERFRPAPQTPRERPRLLYVGRVAVEKNIEAFLALDVPGDKVIVGDGPARAELQRRYPGAIWQGYCHGDRLVAEYAAADVFVFPSRTDTFGLVLLEAMACGTPVAAYPVTGPADVVVPGVTGMLDEDLAAAVRAALHMDRAACRDYAATQSWQAVTRRLVASFAPISWDDPTGAGPSLRWQSIARLEETRKTLASARAEQLGTGQPTRRSGDGEGQRLSPPN